MASVGFDFLTNIQTCSLLKNPCRLCLREVELCDSHIIPEFLYSKMYDDKHRFTAMSADPIRAERYFQKGLREKLLCKDCECRFSVNENYARGIFFGGACFSTACELNLMKLAGVGYRKFRLFELSLLWRMGISTDAFFADVRLGPFEEDLRFKLLNDDIGQPLQYPCAITKVLLQGEPMNILLAPDQVKLYGQTCYRMVITGFLFMFFVSKTPPPTDSLEYFGQADGTRFLHVAECADIPFLRDASLGLWKTMKQRAPTLRRR
jgi:hypothetical protein